MFGPEDQFTNRFAALARMSPVLPLIGGDTKMQPVYVGDVATAVADAVDGKAKAGATYELGGPEVLTMREIIEAILAIADRKPMLMPLPFGLARFKANFLQFAPGALKLTPDQVTLLARDNVVSDAAKAAGLTLEGLGIAPDSLEAIARNISGVSAPPGNSSARARNHPRSQLFEVRGYRPSASAIRPRVPTITRHQANTTKPWRVTYSRNVFTTMMAVTNDTTKPIATMPMWSIVISERFL